MAQHYDALIIGAGQAGPALAERLTQAGMNTALVERKHFGGTCVNTGCVPTKAMVASAHAVFVARRAADFGVRIGGEVRVDMAAVKARKDGIVQQSRDGLAKWFAGMKKLTVIHGHARFVGPKSVEIEGEPGTARRTLTAERIFINAGGRAAIPKIEGVDQVPWLDNSRMMDLDVLPEHLVIVGGSYIGLEFAQMFRRFGSRVTVIEMGPRLIGREDEDVSAEVQAILEREGIEFRLQAECIALSRDGAGIAAGTACASGPPMVKGSHLLLAVGRRPNTDDLGLAAAGIETDERGMIKVDDALSTSVPGVWALGEVNGRGAFTHTSYNDFEIVAANLLDGASRRVTDRIPAYALFVDPPLARVGMSESQVKQSGRRALAAKMPMSRVGRAREKGETLGFMKVVVDAASQEILGAALLGVEADEAVHQILDVMYAKKPYTVIRDAMHIHPTVSELIPTLLSQLKPLG